MHHGVVPESDSSPALVGSCADAWRHGRASCLGPRNSVSFNVGLCLGFNSPCSCKIIQLILLIFFLVSFQRCVQVTSVFSLQDVQIARDCFHMFWGRFEAHIPPTCEPKSHDHGAPYVIFRNQVQLPQVASTIYIICHQNRGIAPCNHHDASSSTNCPTPLCHPESGCLTIFPNLQG